MRNEAIRPEGACEPIAVVGLACRLPGAADPAAFWRLLREGVDAVTAVPEGRWASAGFPQGGSVPGIEDFDADFFGISANEAAQLDPHQRLALELSWEALEHARTAPDSVRGSATGVFLGAMSHDYAALADRLGPAAGGHTYTGTNRAMIANRVSHVLGLTGPSLTVDTGQSSSLVAVHLACESLHRNEIGLALAGGVNLNLLAETTASIGELGALSPDGRCHVFDAAANGYVRGEGGGLVVLKRLSDALRDGDLVHCVILGGAVNHDGGGDHLTMPSRDAQERVIALARARAGVTASEVRYVELHGTGTPVGDPIEAAALGAGNAGRFPAEPLLVGSVKTNLGHLEGAAGIAGLLKVALCVRHRELVPSLHFTTPNPAIPLTELGLRMVVEPEPWPGADRPLLAGVSSFGMGGTNCHLVIGEAPGIAPGETVADTDMPWVLSAHTVPALREQARRLREHLTPADHLADIGVSLLRTRAGLTQRAVVLGDRETALDALASGRSHPSLVTGAVATGQCAFVFPGQGSQWPGMARELLDTATAFADRFGECDRELRPHTGFSAADVLRCAPGAPALAGDDVVQPVLWAVMVSLAALWRAHGVVPELVLGHSQGEIAAATVIGALSLSDGARVSAVRSRIVRGLARSGGMLAVAAPVEEVEALLARSAPEVGIAAVNGPRSVAISGPAGPLAVAESALVAAGLSPRRIDIDYASHSSAIEAVRAEMLAELASVRPMRVPTPFVSAVTGELIDTAELDAGYWYRSLREPVRFAPAVETALAAGVGLFVECSPHPVLLGAVAESAERAGVTGTLRRGQGDLAQFQRALAGASVRGASVRWPEPAGARLVDLPTYPFQRERLWLNEKSAVQAVKSDVDARRLVLDTVADLLGHDAVEATRTFRDLGIDSLAGIDLRDRLRAATGTELPAGVLFAHPTPARLAEFLRGAPAQVAARPVRASAEPIAVVGMGCRYPGGVSSPAELWRLVDSGTDAISEFPTDRGWDLDALFAGGSATRHGGFLHEADRFDAAFFGISPREAAAMDPQQRLLLETSWEAVEHAAIDPATLRDTPTGVFVGATAGDYGPRLHEQSEGASGHLLTGTAASVASGRIAYVLGLRGPAITTDTACSSSLVAILLAVRSLRAGECSLALAGGAAVMAGPGMFVEFSRQGGLAPDGRCKAFAAGADGTGWAEGAGMLLLEPLSAAQAAGHPVLAVIRGGAINSDGASNGLTAPNGAAQQEVIRLALADAGLAPRDVDVLEAHGTGTTLGDPIEAEAVVATYGANRDRPLWIGSLKSNTGHTQAAAGVGGVIKLVQALRHRTLPRTLHADTPTTLLDWGSVRLLTQPVPLTGNTPVRAAVSSFGISGTNAHLILEQAPETPAAEPGRVLVWVLNGRTGAALRSHAGRLRGFAEAATPGELAGAGAVLGRRTAAAHRAVVVAADRAELVAGLAAIEGGVPHPAVVAGVAGVVTPVFVFPGQGGQWVGMGRALLDEDPVFAAELGRCDAALAPLTGWSVADVLREEPGAPALAGSDVVQPVLFAVMVALAALWRSAGVAPAAVLGHSQGEIAAACAAGALSLADAARIVVARSRALLGLTGTGGMLAVALSAGELARRLARWPDRLWVAIESGPASTVVAGDRTALDELAAECGDTVRTTRVDIDYAAHTPHVERVRDELLAAVAGARPQPTDVAFCSAFRGGLVDPATLDADYWYGGLRHPVRFAPAVASLTALGTPLFVEVSPHPVLTGHVRDTLAGSPGTAIGTLRRGHGGRQRFLTALAEAYVHGATVDWPRLLGAVPAVPPEVPTYPFERQRYWLTGDSAPAVHRSDHPLLAAAVPLADDAGIVLTARLSLATTPWLADHSIAGTVLLPGTATVELALAAATATGCAGIGELTLETPVPLPAGGAVLLQVHAGPERDGHRSLTVHSRLESAAEWTRHATGTLTTTAEPATTDRAAWPPSGASALDPAAIYRRLTELGYDYGPAFRGLRAAWRTGPERHVEVALPEPAAEGFTLHPALLDAVLHVIVHDGADAENLLLPFSWRGVRIDAVPAGPLRVRITPTAQHAVSLRIHDTTGAEVGRVDELTLRPVPSAPGADEIQVLTWIAPPPVTTTGTRVANLDALTGDVPGVVLAQVDQGADVRAALAHVLGLVQRWVTESRFAGSRLAVVTPAGVVGAAIRGLVRTAEAEFPGRFAILEADEPVDWTRAGDLIAAGEWQLAARDGTFLVPRLTRGETGPAPDLSSGTVLVTGGTSGLGALTARRLVSRFGVRDLVLVSRSGKASDELLSELDGAKVRVVACDVSDRRALSDLVEELGSELIGVVHAAGVLDDVTVAGLTPEHFDSVLRAKADGAWFLHELTKDLPLRLFCLFSSVVGLLGGAGQANYGAANAYLDGLATYRKSLGLPAVSIVWGLWDAGMGAGADAARFARSGIGVLPVTDGLKLFDGALQCTEPVAVAVRWDRAGLRARTELPPPLRSLVPPKRAPRNEPVKTDLPARLAGLEEHEARPVLVDFVRAHVAAVLAHPVADAVDVDTAFAELGFDSLTSVELRNRLGADAGMTLPAGAVFNHPTVTALAGYLHETLAPAPVSAADTLRAAVDEAAARLGDEPGDDRDAVLAILHSALARFGDSGGGPSAAERIGMASDDEIFNIIDEQLRRS